MTNHEGATWSLRADFWFWLSVFCCWGSCICVGFACAMLEEGILGAVGWLTVGAAGSIIMVQRRQIDAMGAQSQRIRSVHEATDAHLRRWKARLELAAADEKLDPLSQALANFIESAPEQFYDSLYKVFHEQSRRRMAHLQKNDADWINEGVTDAEDR